MLKNITLSAEERHIEAARQRAREQNTTLNAEFRKWLESYARAREEGEERARRFRELVARTKASSGGRKFTREEMNER
jgi:hypothetical protein